MRELTKLLIVGFIASGATLAAVKLFEPAPVYAAPGDPLPPDFQKDARLDWSAAEGGGGKILQTQGEWIQLATPDGDTFWIHCKRPGILFSIHKAK